MIARRIWPDPYTGMVRDDSVRELDGPHPFGDEDVRLVIRSKSREPINGTMVATLSRRLDDRAAANRRYEARKAAKA